MSGQAGRDKEEGLSPEERDFLLALAKGTIGARLTGEAAPPVPAEMSRLRQKRGVFVTLKKRGRLRGCIGYVEALKPLAESVREMALEAAFRDPRFAPLGQEEFREVSFEISVLSPLREIQDVEEIEVGLHGLYIVRGYQAGLLLPQVATEHRWDRRTFLEETCGKAGLPPRAWQERGTRIFVFSVDVFGEGGSGESRGEAPRR
ncbi:MAG: AmmeMemoRadiSam system protein A [Deltaproteobacteria bacterium]|nr:AmmeMemoRadiSam system protein A [Deltaproteobacteria bacterium]